jgi:sugar lactone lactonase YvrE
MRWMTVMKGLALGSAMAMAIPALAENEGCGSKFVCGTKDPEDLVSIPHSPWVIAGSYPRKGKGDLYLIDTRTLEARALNAATLVAARRNKTYDCPTPPDPERFVAHGLSLAQLGKGRSRLFVVGHVGREAIEVFDIDARKATPKIEWVGCVQAPAGVEPNSVVSLPDGGLLFSTLYDPEDHGWKERIGKLGAGVPSGTVFEWHKDKGFTRVALPPLSGPNGIELSPDKRYLFVSGWADGTIHRIDRTGKEAPKSLKLDFLPDNVRWAPDGTLLVTGQNDTVANMFSCNMKPDKPAYCVPGWTVVALDGKKMEIVHKTVGDGGGAFGDATVALAVGGKLWLGAINGERIAVVSR